MSKRDLRRKELVSILNFFVSIIIVIPKTVLFVHYYCNHQNSEFKVFNYMLQKKTLLLRKEGFLDIGDATVMEIKVREIKYNIDQMKKVIFVVVRI